MNFAAYRALFEDKPLVVSPAGGENLIFNDTPLVDVTIGQRSVSVNILDSTPPTPIPASPTPTPTAPKIQPNPDELYRVPDLRKLVGKPLYNAGLYGDFTIINWQTDTAVLRSVFSKFLSGDTWVTVIFNVSAENLRRGSNITFPKQSPLRILSVEKKAGGGILVKAQY